MWNNTKRLLQPNTSVAGVLVFDDLNTLDDSFFSGEDIPWGNGNGWFPFRFCMSFLRLLSSLLSSGRWSLSSCPLRSLPQPAVWWRVISGNFQEPETGANQ